MPTSQPGQFVPHARFCGAIRRGGDCVRGGTTAAGIPLRSKSNQWSSRCRRHWGWFVNFGSAHVWGDSCQKGVRCALRDERQWRADWASAGTNYFTDNEQNIPSRGMIGNWSRSTGIVHVPVSTWLRGIRGDRYSVAAQLVNCVGEHLPKRRGAACPPM